jgi:DNA-binding MurR/RpiR family transcriptional regulator
VQRYSRHFRLLADQASARAVPLVIVTDSQCHWAPELTDEVLMLPLESGRAWHSQGSMTILLSMLLDSVIGELGEVYDRIEDVVELRQQLIGYTGTAQRRRRKRRP